jgi:hypothetical protein
MKMNGPNGKKIDRPGSGSAKVFARFPIVLISVICSVCYRMRATRMEPGAHRRFLPPCVRLNEITR